MLVSDATNISGYSSPYHMSNHGEVSRSSYRDREVQESNIVTQSADTRNLSDDGGSQDDEDSRTLSGYTHRVSTGTSIQSKLSSIQNSKLSIAESLYNRLLSKLQNDEEWIREVRGGRRIGLYRVKGELGIGNFSRVKLALHELTRERVAIKIIDRGNLDTKTAKMLLREISVMSSCNHPSLVRLFEVIEKKDKIYLCMQLATGGELFTRLTQIGKYTEDRAKFLFLQIASGIKYMHDNGMIHRDLKAENIFYISKNRVVIGDFGFATKLGRMDQHLYTFCGSPPYAAPELFKDDHYIGPAVDIWALGILLYFMVTGNMPFKSSTVSGLKHAILEGIYYSPTTLTDECKELINNMLQRNPEHRLELEELTKSDWLQGFTWVPEDKDFVPYPRLGSENLSDVEKCVINELGGLGILQKDFSMEMGLGIRSKAVGAYRILLTRTLQQLAQGKTRLVKRSATRNPDSASIGVNTDPIINSSAELSELYSDESSGISGEVPRSRSTPGLQQNKTSAKHQSKLCNIL